MQKDTILQVLHSEERDSSGEGSRLLVVVNQKELVYAVSHCVEDETVEIKDWHTTRVHLDDEHGRHHS